MWKFVQATPSISITCHARIHNLGRPYPTLSQSTHVSSVGNSTVIAREVTHRDASLDSGTTMIGFTRYSGSEVQDLLYCQVKQLGWSCRKGRAAAGQNCEWASGHGQISVGCSKFELSRDAGWRCKQKPANTGKGSYSHRCLRMINHSTAILLSLAPLSGG